jgi:hypothetical protein
MGQAWLEYPGLGSRHSRQSWDLGNHAVLAFGYRIGVFALGGFMFEYLIDFADIWIFQFF